MATENILRCCALGDVPAGSIASPASKYSLARVADGACVLRYDNEAGKGDHRHDPGWWRIRDVVCALATKPSVWSSLCKQRETPCPRTPWRQSALRQDSKRSTLTPQSAPESTAPRHSRREKSPRTGTRTDSSHSDSRVVGSPLPDLYCNAVDSARINEKSNVVRISALRELSRVPKESR